MMVPNPSAQNSVFAPEVSVRLPSKRAKISSGTTSHWLYACLLHEGLFLCSAFTFYNGVSHAERCMGLDRPVCLADPPVLNNQ
eukprot:7023886-Pyramimonas_sp.AAC.1